MKNIILLISLICFNGPIMAQHNYKVTGHIQEVSYYQGGMELPQEYRLPKPLINYTVWIVKHNGPDAIPTLIKPVTTDSVGNFIIKLPEGQYGFILTDKKKDLKKGSHTPQNDSEDLNEIPDSGISTSDTWTLNSYGPFQVSENGKNHAIFTHYSVTVCYKCP